MATVKISELPAILGANTAATDVIPIVDVSGNITNKITRDEFFKNIQGNVGIGTTSPYSKLDIVQATAGYGGWKYGASLNATDFPALRFLATTGNTGSIIAHEAGATVFLTGTTATGAGTERMRIDTSGNVGVGITNPAYKLVVSAAGASGIEFGPAYSGTANLIQHYSRSGGVYVDAVNDAAQHRFNTSGTERMRIDSSGNVGIGTTSPSADLSVGSTTTSSGDVHLRTSKTAVELTPSNSDAGGMDLNVGWVAGGQGPLKFSLGSTERARIDSSGNLGIGNTAPIVPLHVTGDTMTTGVVYKNQPAQTSKAAAATLTIAELETGIIQYTGAAATLTLPTGTLIEGGVPASFPVNMAFDFSVINTGSGTATLGTATGLTLVGSMAVTAGVSGMFRVRKTATNTYTVYRIG